MCVCAHGALGRGGEGGQQQQQHWLELPIKAAAVSGSVEEEIGGQGSRESESRFFVFEAAPSPLCVLLLLLFPPSVSHGRCGKEQGTEEEEEEDRGGKVVLDDAYLLVCEHLHKVERTYVRGAFRSAHKKQKNIPYLLRLQKSTNDGWEEMLPLSQGIKSVRRIRTLRIAAIQARNSLFFAAMRHIFLLGRSL